MNLQTKIWIGFTVAAFLTGGIVFLFLNQSKRFKQEVKALQILNAESEALKIFWQQEARKIREDLKEAKKDAALLLLKEKIYEDKIKVDSAVLKEIQQANNEIDSLSNYYSLEQWECYIANQISEDCNN